MYTTTLPSNRRASPITAALTPRRTPQILNYDDGMPQFIYIYIINAAPPPQILNYDGGMPQFIYIYIYIYI